MRARRLTEILKSNLARFLVGVSVFIVTSTAVLVLSMKKDIAVIINQLLSNGQQLAKIDPLRDRVSRLEERVANTREHQVLFEKKVDDLERRVAVVEGNRWSSIDQGKYQESVNERFLRLAELPPRVNAAEEAIRRLTEELGKLLQAALNKE